MFDYLESLPQPPASRSTAYMATSFGFSRGRLSVRLVHVTPFHFPQDRRYSASQRNLLLHFLVIKLRLADEIASPGLLPITFPAFVILIIST